MYAKQHLINARLRSAKVLEACNFKGHEIQATVEGELLEKGFYVGRRVQLTKRMSVKQDVEGTTDKKYADIKEGSVGTVAGVVEGKPAVTFFNLIVKGEQRSCTVAVKTSSLSFEIPEASSSSGSASASATTAAQSQSAVPKNMEFLLGADGDTIDIHKQWHLSNATNAIETQVKSLHSKLGMALAMVISEMPVYTSKDFYVITRNKRVVEVWTARAFAKHEIKLAPETTEFKEKVWTQTRSCLVKYGTQ